MLSKLYIYNGINIYVMNVKGETFILICYQQFFYFTILK